jgi:hypothetical protein
MATAVPFTLQHLAVGPHSLRLPYQKRTKEQKTALHWGQRKLLLSEIEFFSLYWDPQNNPTPTCVYAGAAPGIHIPLLSQMFPPFIFHLYDPAEFRIKPTDKIQIFQQYFTDEVAKTYAGRRDVFFVCDIRTADYRQIHLDTLKEYGITTFDASGAPVGDPTIIKKAYGEAQVKNEDQIWGDMQWQRTWVMLMNPEHAFLKFRLPYAIGDNKTVKYLKGIVYWQIWPPQTSTETRLKPVRNPSGQYEDGDWDILEYEQWSFYHNKIEREDVTYLNPFTGNQDPIDPPELLNDYDSVAEAMILRAYFQKIGVTDPQTLYDKVKHLSRAITWSLNFERSDEQGAKSLTQKRQSPVKTTSKAAIDAYKAKVEGRRYEHAAMRHTKLTIDQTWRQPASPITTTVTLPPLTGAVTVPRSPSAPVQPVTLPPIGGATVQPVALPKSPMAVATPMTLPPLGGAIAQSVTLPPLGGAIAQPVTLPPLGGAIAQPVTLPQSPVIPMTLPVLGGATVQPVPLPRSPAAGVTPVTLPPLGSAIVQPVTVPKSPSVGVVPATLPRSPVAAVTPITLPPLGGAIAQPITVPKSPSAGVTPVALPRLGATVQPVTLSTLGGAPMQPMTLPKSPVASATPVTLPPLGGMIGQPMTLPTLGATPVTIPRSPSASVTPITLPTLGGATPVTIPRSPSANVTPVMLPSLGGATVQPMILPTLRGTAVNPVTLPKF